jgi:hypothetical protein
VHEQATSRSGEAIRARATTPPPPPPSADATTSLGPGSISLSVVLGPEIRCSNYPSHIADNEIGLLEQDWHMQGLFGCSPTRHCLPRKYIMAPSPCVKSDLRSMSGLDRFD